MKWRQVGPLWVNVDKITRMRVMSQITDAPYAVVVWLTSRDWFCAAECATKEEAGQALQDFIREWEATQ